MVKSLNGGATAHTVLTELDDQKRFSRGMASIKGTASKLLELLYFFKSIIKIFQIILSPK